MATSPIYGWAEPDNTDLVKNGALAIRTLGNAIDTTMGTMVAKTIIDAKGDLIAGSAADTALRLAVGSNGETLVADSSTSTGLRYQAPVAANPVINSAFQVWQRGTSISVPASTTAFTTDRFMLEARPSQACTVSRQVTNDTTNLPFIQYCARIQRNSGQTGTFTNYFTTSFETVNSIPFVGKTVTLSFYARKGADYSATSSILVSNVASGTGTDQNISVSYTGNTDQTQNNTLTANWQRFSQTVTIASSKTEIALGFSWTPVGTAGTNDYYEITGIQLEVGSVATQFKTNGATFQGELAACQRYYWRSSVGTAYGTYGLAYAISTTLALASVQFPVAMRTNPASVDFSSLAIDFSGSFASAVSAISLGQASTVNAGLTCTTTGLTQYRVYDLCNNNNTAAYLGFSAEL